MLAGSEDCSLWMWNADKEAYLNMFSGHNLNVTCGDFTPDGIDISFYLKCFMDCLIESTCFHCIVCLCVDTVGKLICTGSDDASLIVWNPKTCESIHVVKGKRNLNVLLL